MPVEKLSAWEMNVYSDTEGVGTPLERWYLMQEGYRFFWENSGFNEKLQVRTQVSYLLVAVYLGFFLFLLNVRI